MSRPPSSGTNIGIVIRWVERLPVYAGLALATSAGLRQLRLAAEAYQAREFHSAVMLPIFGALAAAEKLFKGFDRGGLAITGGGANVALFLCTVAVPIHLGPIDNSCRRYPRRRQAIADELRNAATPIRRRCSQRG